MNKFTHLIFSLALLVTLSFGVAAQRNDDQKKPPPKDSKNPPVIKPGNEKPPPRDKDKDKDKPKKPESGYSIFLPNKNEYFA